MTVFTINNHNTALFTWHDFSSETHTVILEESATHDRDIKNHTKYRMQYCNYLSVYTMKTVIIRNMYKTSE